MEPIPRRGAEDRRVRREEVGPELTGRVIAAAIAVHRELGPGLLESAYRKCLAWEFEQVGIRFTQEVILPLTYRGNLVASGYRADMIVEDQVLLELKSVDALLPVHAAQARTYLRLSGCKVALLINFNTALLKNGVRRFIP